MFNFLFRLWANIIALLIVVLIFPGIKVSGIETALWAALMLGALNTFLKPVLMYLTLPLNVFSLGLFTLFINAFLFYLVSKILVGFVIVDFWSAFWGAMSFSIFSAVINFFINPVKSNNVKFKTHTFYNRGQQQRSKPAKYKDVIDVEAKVDDVKKNLT
jgi:putative membrane protein